MATLLDFIPGNKTPKKRPKTTKTPHVTWGDLKKEILKRAGEPQGELSYTTLKKQPDIVFSKIFYGINTIALVSDYPLSLTWGADENLVDIIADASKKRAPYRVEKKTPIGTFVFEKQPIKTGSKIIAQMTFKKTPVFSEDVVFLQKPPGFEATLKGATITYEGQKYQLDEIPITRARILGDLLNQALASKASVKRLLKCIEKKGAIGLLSVSIKTNDGIQSGVEFFVGTPC